MNTLPGSVFIFLSSVKKISVHSKVSFFAGEIIHNHELFGDLEDSHLGGGFDEAKPRTSKINQNLRSKYSVIDCARLLAIIYIVFDLKFFSNS